MTDKKENDEFWNIQKKKPAAYAAPEYGEDKAPGFADIIDDSASAPSAHSEPVPDRMSSAASDKAEDGGKGGGFDNIYEFAAPKEKTETPQYTTSSYKKRAADFSRKKDTVNSKNRTITKYKPQGPLIRKITVKNWNTDSGLYNSFRPEAIKYHSMTPQYRLGEFKTVDNDISYFNYIPQYRHLSDDMREYYLEIRDVIRAGEYDRFTSYILEVRNNRTGFFVYDREFPYIMLYIFEILNLPEDVLAPNTGLEILSSIWLGLRGVFPRIDSYLCDWLPDYCMIHNLNMPRSLLPIMPYVIFKASFKDFYLNINPEDGEEGPVLARMLIEMLSDYNYSHSRCYSENEELFDRHIIGAVTSVIISHYTGKRGFFSEDKTLRTTRDTYSGSIISSDVKKRLDIEFISITRRFEYRVMMTSIVKYAENKIRMMIKVKSKLSAKDISPEDSAIIDAYFSPYLADIKAKTAKAAEEAEREEYLKNYEAETHGFDLSAAEEIERKSWSNTERLVSDTDTEDFTSDVPSPVTPDVNITVEITVPDKPLSQQIASQQIVSDNTETDRITDNEKTTEDTPENKSADGATSIDTGAVRAALEGRFGEFARDKGIFPGRLADEINTLFLGVIGDILLEDNGNGYELIEDYREDAITWLKTK